MFIFTKRTDAYLLKCLSASALNRLTQRAPEKLRLDAPADGRISRYNALVERHEKLQSRYGTLQKKRERRLIKADVMSGFLFAITELDNLQLQFNPPLWHTTVDHVTVYADECLVFHFRNGCEVEVRL